MTTSAEAARAAVARVKAALDSEGRTPFAFYLLRGGTIAASSRSLMAAAPFPWPGEAFVSGDEFEGVLARAPDGISFVAGEDRLTISVKRFRGTVKTAPAASAWDCVPPDDSDARPIDAEALDRFRALEPFVSDDPSPAWTNAFIIQRGRCAAVGPGGTIFAMASCPDFGIDALIPKRALSIVLKAPVPPTRMALDEHRAAWWWADGAWLRTSLVAGRVPGTVDSLAERALAGAGAPEISLPWRIAFERVAGFAEGRVRFYADRIAASNGVGEVEDEAETAIPAGKTFVEWPAAFAKLVVDAADRWDLASHPSTFAGKLVRGIVAALK